MDLRLGGGGEGDGHLREAPFKSQSLDPTSLIRPELSESVSEPSDPSPSLRDVVSEPSESDPESELPDQSDQSELSDPRRPCPSRPNLTPSLSCPISPIRPSFPTRGVRVRGAVRN